MFDSKDSIDGKERCQHQICTASKHISVPPRLCVQVSTRSPKWTVVGDQVTDGVAAVLPLNAGNVRGNILWLIGICQYLLLCVEVPNRFRSIHLLRTRLAGKKKFAGRGHQSRRTWMAR